MRYEHLRAPAEDGGVLIEPALAQLHVNWRAADAPADLQILDTSLTRLQTRLRERLGLPGRVVLTGHQAEFYHAGVLAKRMFTDAWQRTLGGSQVYLSVDSDTPKSDRITALRAADRPQGPPGGGSNGAPSLAARLTRSDIQLPRCDTRLPVEHQPRAELDAWRGFFAELRRAACEPAVTALPVYEQEWLAAYDARRDLTGAFIAGNTAVERAAGLGDALQLRVSELAETPEFRTLAAHLLLKAADFRAAYNAAQLNYRQRRHVRNPARPAPPLAQLEGRVETPLWLVRPGSPRARLFVEPSGDSVRLWADHELAGSEDRGSFATSRRHEEPWAVQDAGWRLRPRALALSSFCRLILCDLFVHGIGGAKYDEMTDDFCGAFFGRQPGPMACVTATMRLALPSECAPKSVNPQLLLAAARRAVRDYQYNPQRYLAQASGDLLRERGELIRQNEELRAGGRRNRTARRDIYQRLRAINGALADSEPQTRARLDDDVQVALAAAHSASILADREYFYALQRLDALQHLAREFQQRVQHAIGAGVSPAR